MKKYVRKINYSKYVVDKDLNILEIDKKFEDITGYTIEDVKEMKLNQVDLVPEADRIDYVKLCNLILSREDEAYFEHRIERKDGEKIFVFCLGIKNITENENDITSEIRIVRMDDSLSLYFQEESFKEKIMDLENEAKKDNLTNLLRRDPFIKSVNSYIANEKKFAFFLIDIDRFKSINDTYGHNIGDKVLVKISDTVKTSLRNNDLICRMGGDEFAFVLKYNNKAEVDAIAKRLIEAVASIKYEGIDLKTTLSIGIKLFRNDKDATLFDELYVLADEALYKSKENGRNQYTYAK